MKIKLNPDKKKVSEIKKKLKTNGGFCPCSLINSDDTKCMCKAFRDQVARGEAGECLCGLYIAEQETTGEGEDKDATAKDVSVENTSVHQKNTVSDAVDDKHGNIVGKIVKIKDNVKLFCGGNAIPDWVRKSDLYISRENKNGTVMIALSDSCTDVDILFKRDVIFTDKERTFADSNATFEKISVRIFGVPSRIKNIRENQTRLHIPDENIFIDEKHDGCVKTAMRAWSYPTDKEFVLVLQDDVELCDNFVECCNKIVNAHPFKIISLFPIQLMSRNNVWSLVKNLKSPYVFTGSEGTSGCGIIMRTEWIPDCLKSWEGSGLNGDDTNINAWAKKTGTPIITTVPATIQHIGDVSVFDRSRSIGRSELYSKNAAKSDWDNEYVTRL